MNYTKVFFFFLNKLYEGLQLTTLVAFSFSRLIKISISDPNQLEFNIVMMQLTIG